MKNTEELQKAALHIRNLCIKFSTDARSKGEDEIADAYSDIANRVDDVARARRNRS